MALQRKNARMIFTSLLIAFTACGGGTKCWGVGPLGTPEYNWIMHCQGCHGEQGQGAPHRVPQLTGKVGTFLKLEAGRAYLARVPGIAFSELSDADVAELLNWLVIRFDEEHVPKTFKPYSAAEIQGLRRRPLISGAYRERRRILSSIGEGS
jgi:hypothetical protein